MKKEIIYPFFLQCCKFTQDLYWEIVFENLAYGKTPYGTYLTDDYFCCNFKNKDFSYKLDKENPEKIYKDIYKLLVKKLNLVSHNERLEKIKKITEIENEKKESRQNWTSIKKKSVKDLFIEKYAIEMKNKYNLTVEQTNYLISYIFIGLSFKILN